MWSSYHQPETLAEAVALLGADPAARLVAGGTDVLVELGRGLRPAETLIDLTRVAGLRYVSAEGGRVRLGALATHNDVIASPACVAAALPLAQASLEVGAPQIRARATVAGNLVTASPANDTITALVALGAELAIAGPGGERALPIAQFYTGVRRTALQPGEILREVSMPALGPARRGLFLKLGLRRAQAIAVVNVAAVLTFEGEGPGAPVAQASLALGCVAPTIVRAAAAEAALVGRPLSEMTIAEAAALALEACAPIDDVRGSAVYRREAVAALVARALARIAARAEAEGWPARPVLLEVRAAQPKAGSFDLNESSVDPKAGSGTVDQAPEAAPPSSVGSVQAVVNGAPAALSPRKTLLDALREDAGLTGAKEGCAEGECGACTVWLDGQAVMSCLVPAAQANGRQVTTIEGLAAAQRAALVKDGSAADEPHPSSLILHPLQASFIAEGAVQCGYCIPGMLMAGARLLAEHPQPDLGQIQAALGGNICRCTGYSKIIAAVQAAAQADEG